MNFRQMMAANIQRAVAARLVELGLGVIDMVVVDEIVEMACKDSARCTIEVEAYVRRLLVVKDGELWLNG